MSNHLLAVQWRQDPVLCASVAACVKNGNPTIAVDIVGNVYCFALPGVFSFT